MNAKTIAPFQLYQASAGAGKTFLLVQKYLTKLLSGHQEDSFHRILALTFTNKAVFEMKFRILKQLHYLANTKEDLTLNPMGKALLVDLKISPNQLKKRAKDTLELVLHDYAAFDVITLDSFTHRIIRSFAKDLGLGYNFEVELQTDGILKKVVEQVMDKVGEQQQLTRLLEAFTYQKMDDEATTSWDLKENLLTTARLLLNENNREEIKTFIHQSNQTIDERYKMLLSQKREVKEALIQLGKDVLHFLTEQHLDPSHFNRQTFYNRFLKLSKGNFERYDSGKLHENLKTGKGIYTAKTPEEVKSKMDVLMPNLLNHYENGLAHYYRWQLIGDILKQWIPLNLLATLAQALEDYQSETNRVLLSTFNERIAKEILWQSSPYIYERLGENYRHYFLDEFQDTSSLQWKNLIPLIKSSVESQSESGQTGTLLLVGDPKQSIYRWRGGNVEQFIDLIGEENPFTVDKEINNLETNYRSAKGIVTFNNALYTALANHLEYEENKVLFGNRAAQGIKNTEEGYVRLSFLEMEENAQIPYANRVIEDALKCHQLGYGWGEMAILVRTKKQAQFIVKTLLQENIPYVSSESLVLAQSPVVKFLMTLVYLHSHPRDMAQKKAHLEFLYDGQERSLGLHEYLSKHLYRPLKEIWNEEGINFNLNWFDQRGLYAVFQTACSCFPSIVANDVFVLCFLDEVFDFALQNTADAASFLIHWEQQGHQKTLTTTDANQGIRLMTIHQAKGLEFPIVFFPYADRSIHSKHKEKLWLDTSSILGEEFPLAWVSNSARLLNYGKAGERAYKNKLRQEEIDAWNVFYVATTRAVEQLYLYVAKEQIEKDSYATFLADFVTVNGKQLEEQIFEWGKLASRAVKKQSKELNQCNAMASLIYPYEEKLMLQRKTIKEQEQARWFGVKIHNLISRIHYADEVENVLAEAAFYGEITLEEKNKINLLFNELVNDSNVAPYFTRDYTVMNEQSILVPKTKILRPDRVVFNREKAIVIDYKTGKKNEKHSLQIQDYARWIFTVLERPVEAFLVYMDYEFENKIDVVEVFLT